MKLRQGLLIIVLLMALPVISGCACSSKISADEAIAIVQQSGTEYDDPVLGKKYTIPEMLPYRPELGEWRASYKGKGHWIVTCVFDHGGEPWNNPDGIIWTVRYDYYENSGIVQFKDQDIHKP